MNKSLSRRDFLKLMAALPAGAYLSQFAAKSRFAPFDSERKNVIVIVFDALSAKDISLYGYPRETMPNLNRMAEKATVYHNHYAGGNFTTPGTASLLTGTYPWTHRAMRLSSRIPPEKRSHNIFKLFDQHYRVAYTHNPIAEIHLDTFRADIDYLKPQSELFIRNNLALDRWFPRDYDTASVAWNRIMSKEGDGDSYSLFLSDLYEKYRQERIKDIAVLFPEGMPKASGSDYILEETIDWIKRELAIVPQPFLGYFHLLPPHHPYTPRVDYMGRFGDDGVGSTLLKPKSIFSEISGEINLRRQGRERRLYDEFLLYADGELGRLYDYLLETHMVDNTWIVFTSDHGEMFERGIFQHQTPALYEPVIRVPLVILEPGQQQRRDVHVNTSAVDVLPTLLKVSGYDIPEWIEGTVLPGYAETEPKADRKIYALEAISQEDGTLNPASVMMVKGKYKLTYYYGYEQLAAQGPLFELYDLEEDPEELNNLFDPDSEISQALQAEFLEKFKEINKPV